MIRILKLNRMVGSNTIIPRILIIFNRKYSAKCAVIPDELVINNINNNVIKPRKHPGVLLPRTILIPDAFIKSIIKVTEDYPIKKLLAEGEKLNLYLKSKVPPMEIEQLNELIQNIQNRIRAEIGSVNLKNEEDESKYLQKVKDKTQHILKNKVYNWQPVKYNAYNCFLYLLGRSAAEYSVLVKIFGEIQTRDPEFTPRSLFDFGSGTGTVSWAANCYWKQNIFEYFNVDISRDMNDLAQVLLQDGKSTGNLPKGVFYRQFLPSSRNTYDLVISAYTMMELPSSQSRLETILNLWNKTGKYLIIVERGTNAGFKVVTEIRDYILQIEKENSRGHVFSPCPHDQACPRFLLDDGTPCNFEVTYFSLPIGGPSVTKKELYSYVVLKKGVRDSSDKKWPRLVRPTLVRAKHSICRMCSASGELKEVIFTASKFGKVVYHCARSSRWGDRLPMTIEHNDENSNEVVNNSNNIIDNMS